MTPKYRGMLEELKKLQNNCDRDAEDFLGAIQSADARRIRTFADSKTKLNRNINATLDGMNEFFADLEKTNGGPTLDGSAGSPQPAAAAESNEPSASWTGNKA